MSGDPLILVLDEAVPSRNAIDKMHWSARQKLRSRWQWLLRASLLNARTQKQCFPHADLTIERYGPRKLDEDNFVGGAKQLIDALRHEGFIVNDDPAHLRVKYIQVSSGEPATRLTLTAFSP